MATESSTPKILILALIGVHTLQVLLFFSAMNIRTTFAILMFAGCTAFAERFTENNYVIPWLRAFGVIGMVALMTILQFTIESGP